MQILSPLTMSFCSFDKIRLSSLAPRQMEWLDKIAIESSYLKPLFLLINFS